jgi:toxin ParE1/3/4
LPRVVFAESARADLDDIFAWIADHAGLEVALAYTSRPGLRTVGFERRATIAFTVKGEDVVILRILYAGRSLDLAFDESF